ncbi:Hypothetical protein BFF97_00063 [Corynebacterium pseudotuberculosis]|nr:Hypothetical protein BFF97_00063 [Corynebacterium pseudotuberculosis]
MFPGVMNFTHQRGKKHRHFPSCSTFSTLLRAFVRESKRVKGVESVMEFLPYEAFEGEVAPVASASDAEIIAGVKAIVKAEGPVLGSRLFVAYCRASNQKLGRRIRERLMFALEQALNSGDIVADIPFTRSNAEAMVLRPRSRPAVVVRSLGPRSLKQVPLAELQTVMCGIEAENPKIGKGDLYKQTLIFYDRWGKLSNKVRLILDPAYDAGGLGGEGSRPAISRPYASGRTPGYPGQRRGEIPDYGPKSYA